jgi:hypothetical protein
MGTSPGLDARGFVRSQMHLLAGCAFFIPGLFCILKSRQISGGAHVFRGALGFCSLGALVYLLSDLVQFWIHTDSGGKIRFIPVDPLEVTGLFMLGILTALFLFWPARRLSSASAPAGMRE